MDASWGSVRFVIRRNVIIGLQCKEDSSRRFTSVASRFASTMNQIDAFPEHISMTVVPVTLLEKPHALAGPCPCLHHLPGTQHEMCVCLVL
ncbi:hypothetical protein TNCV_125501 [Trichonephila clavipes]|nr:hypothetical protein TNCV_125501 [Trichonephila clavipes]